MGALSVRRTTAGDASRLAEIADAAYAAYLPRLPAGVRPTPMDADYDAVARADETWVVADEQSVVGFVVLLPEPDHLLLENIAVHPDHRGRGVGRMLLALVEERARTLGSPAIRLYTNAVMVENQWLYEGLGYVETGRRREGGLDRIFYEKPV